MSDKPDGSLLADLLYRANGAPWFDVDKSIVEWLEALTHEQLKHFIETGELKK